MILPSDALSPTTNAVGWFHCPAPALAEWLAGNLGKPGDWASRLVSAPTFVDLCRLVAAEPLVEDEREREIPEVTHLPIPFGGWTALPNNDRWGTHAQTYPSRVAEDLRCRALRAPSPRAFLRDDPRPVRGRRARRVPPVHLQRRLDGVPRPTTSACRSRRRSPMCRASATASGSDASCSSGPSRSWACPSTSSRSSTPRC